MNEPAERLRQFLATEHGWNGTAERIFIKEGAALVESALAAERQRTVERILLDLLADFYAPDEARLWLYARHPLLAGSRPYDQIRDGRIDDVLALIDQLRSGAVV